MRTILLSLGVILVGCFSMVYGTLLALRPDAFLRFHDTFVDRCKWNRNAAWRKNLYNWEYKMLGVVMLVVGLFFGIIAVMKLISNQH